MGQAASEACVGACAKLGPRHQKMFFRIRLPARQKSKAPSTV
jgi:hypothetical protein